MISWPAQKLLLCFACPDRFNLQRIILVAFSTWYDNNGNCKKTKQKNAHNRAYSVQHSHLAEMSSLPFFRQGRTACSAQSTSSLADAGRSQPPRERRLVLLSLSGSPQSLLEWGSLPTLLCASCCHLSLLPVNRQREMASGGLWCFRVLPDLGLEK